MSDLRGVSAPDKVSFGASGKIFGMLIVAAGIAAMAAYGYATGQFNVHKHQHPVVSDSQLPTTGAPGQ